jgi:hypothetical protein
LKGARILADAAAQHQSPDSMKRDSSVSAISGSTPGGQNGPRQKANPETDPT